MPLRGKAPEIVARSGIALVPEGRRIFAELTVEENLRLGLAGRHERARAGDDLESVYALFPIVKEYRRRQAGDVSVQIVFVDHSLASRMSRPSSAARRNGVPWVYGSPK